MPFKDPKKRRDYHRDYQQKRRKRQKAILQLERDRFIVVKEMRKRLIARTVMPIKWVDSYFTIGLSAIVRGLPILSKLYKLGDKEGLKNAAIALAEIEDKFCLTGEHHDFPCFNIKGLALAEGRIVVTEKVNKIVDVAIKALRAYENEPPYNMILNSKHEWFGAIWLNDERFKIKYSPNIFREDGTRCDGLLLKCTDKNYIAMALGVTLSLPKIPTTKENLDCGQIAEMLFPVIHDPTAICELRFKGEK